MNNTLLTSIIVVLIFAAMVGILIYKKRVPQAKKIILALVIDAELRFGSKTGDLKYAYVVGFIYPRLSGIIRLFITEKVISSWIDEAVCYLKKELSPIQVTTILIKDASTAIIDSEILK